MVSRFSTYLLLLLAVVLLAGCGYYSFSGSLPSHIETAAVPLFENETTEVGLVEDITDAIEEAVLANGTMQIAGEFQADALISGTIVDVIDEADVYTESEEGRQFRLRVLADVTFLDRVKNQVLWEGASVEGWALYDPAGGPSAREGAKEKALEMLANEIIDQTVTGW